MEVGEQETFTDTKSHIKSALLELYFCFWVSNSNLSPPKCGEGERCPGAPWREGAESNPTGGVVMATPNLPQSGFISHLQPAFSHLEQAALHLKKKKEVKIKTPF